MVPSRRAMTIPNVVRTETVAQSRSAPTTRRSFVRFRVRGRTAADPGTASGVVALTRPPYRSLRSLPTTPVDSRTREGREVREVLGVLLGRLRDVADLLDQRGAVREVEVHERGDLGASRGRLRDVDEERARERRVRAVQHRVGTRRDAAVAAVDLESLQLVLVLLEVCEPEVAHAALVAGDALHEYVVIGRRRVVGARDALLAVDRGGEVVERARVGVGAVEHEVLVGPVGVDLVPLGDRRALVP